MKELIDKIKGIISYYDSEDFRNNYAEFLLEDRQAVVDRIKDTVNSRGHWEMEKFYNNPIHFIDDSVAEAIFDEILENVEEFTETYDSYYVGYTSIDSIAYGEQEEDLKEDVEKYGKEAVRKAYEDANFYVNDICTYAYLDMTAAGVHIDLRGKKLKVLTDIIEHEQADID
jgi:subtilase family serine protease